MSRRRQLEPVVHGYWPHSDPEPAPPVETVTRIPSRSTTHHGQQHQHLLGETPCAGPCNRAFREAEETAEAEYRQATIEERDLDPAVMNHDVAFHPGKPVWCRDVTHVDGNHVIVDHHGCQERILADLVALPDLAANLTPGPLNTPRDIRADDRGMGSSGIVHPPTNSPAWDAADDLIRWAVHLEDQLRARLNHDDRGSMTWRALDDAIRYLSAYSTALLSGPDARQVGKQIMHRKRELEQNTGHDRLVHRLTGGCPRCNRRGRMTRKDGDDLVQCGACHATWDIDHWELLSKAIAQSEPKGQQAG
jgi:hypothetical protein